MSISGTGARKDATERSEVSYDPNESVEELKEPDYIGDYAKGLIDTL